MRRGIPSLRWLRNLRHLQRSGNLDAVPDAAGHRTVVGVEAVDALGSFALFGRQLQVIGDVNPPDHQHIIFFFHFSFYRSGQIAFPGRNFARFQRATKGAGQSAAGGSNHVVDGGGMGFMHLGINVVMFGYF